MDDPRQHMAQRPLTLDCHANIRREMEMGNADYVRGVLDILLAHVRQEGEALVVDTNVNGDYSLDSADAFDRFLAHVNDTYSQTSNVRFDRCGGAIRLVRLDEDEALLQPITEAIVDEVHPEAIILFGSRASASCKPGSDVDLLVVVPDSEEARRHRRKLTGRLYRRLAAFPVAKDILVYTRPEVERWRSSPGHIIATTLEQGRRLYGRI